MNRHPSARKKPVDPGLVRLLAPLLALPALLLIVGAMDAPAVLGIAVVGLAFGAMVLRPQWATLAVLFLLYINAPAVAILHGTPKPIAGALVLLLGIPLADRLVLRRKRIRSDRIMGLLLAFLVVMVLSSLGAPDKVLAADRVVSFVTEGLLLYWLVINTVTNRAELKRAVWALLAAGVFLGSLSAYQAVTRSYEQQFGGFAERQLAFEHKREADAAAGRLEDRMYRADRAEGPLLGANRYAQVMLVLIPLAFMMVRGGPKRRRRWIAVSVLAVITGALLLSYSRGGILGLVAVVGASAFLGWVRPKHLVIGLVSVAVLLPVVAPSVYKRVATIEEVTALDDPTTDSSIRGRATEMLAALFVFADHPALGVGPGQYAPYYSVEYQQIPGISFRDLQVTRRAHSLYFEMAAELGIFGLLIFLTIPILLMRRLWAARRRLLRYDPELADIAGALWLGFIGFLCTAFLLSHAFERYFWLQVAMASATLHVIRSLPIRRPIPREVAAVTGPAGPEAEWVEDGSGLSSGVPR